LKGERVKKLLSSQEALEARLGLCEFFLENNTGVDDVKNLIATIQIAVYSIEKKNMREYFDF
jgi:hypothetical protein